MSGILFVILTLLLCVLLLRGVFHIRAAAAKIKAGPDPIRVAMLQQEAIKTALQHIDTSRAESPEVLAKRRAVVLELQRTMPSFALA